MKNALYIICGLILGVALCFGLYLVDPAGASETSIDYALSVMQWSGSWSQTVYYQSQSLVSFTDGCFYLAKQENQGMSPKKFPAVWLKLSCGR